MKTVTCRHAGGGSLVYSMGGSMHRLDAGDRGDVPIGVYERHRDKLRRVDVVEVPGNPPIPHETTQMQAHEALPEWPKKMKPEDYLARYGDQGRYSELAHKLTE